MPQALQKAGEKTKSTLEVKGCQTEREFRDLSFCGPTNQTQKTKSALETKGYHTAIEVRDRSFCGPTDKTQSWKAA